MALEIQTVFGEKPSCLRPALSFAIFVIPFPAPHEGFARNWVPCSEEIIAVVKHMQLYQMILLSPREKPPNLGLNSESGKWPPAEFRRKAFNLVAHPIINYIPARAQLELLARVIDPSETGRL